MSELPQNLYAPADSTVGAALEAMADLFSDSRRWTKGAGARDNDQNMVLVHDSEAACWCLVGAFILVAPNNPGMQEVLGLCLGAAIRKNYPMRWSSCSRFNDHPDTGIEDIQQVIAQAQKTESRLMGTMDRE